VDLTPILLYIDDSNRNGNYSNVLDIPFFKVVDKIPETRFIYPIFLPFDNSRIPNVTIPDPILYSINQGNCLILISHYHEAETWKHYEYQISWIQQSHNLSDDKFVFLTGNVIESLKYKSVFCNSWEPASFSANCINEQRKATHFIFKDERRPYKFICLNQRARDHRFALVAGLYPYRDQGLLSFHYFRADGQASGKNKFIQNYPKYNRRWDNLDLEYETPIKLPIQFDQEGWHKTCVIDRNVEKFYQSYLHIISETHVSHTFFTEKTYKPIKYFQPFVMINGQYSLRHFRELGYQTFDGYIDERYDFEPDNERRIEMAIQASLDFINQEDLHEVMKEMYPIFQHNYNIFIKRCSNFQDTLYSDISNILYAQDHNANQN
jgi:hypothetical protein